MAITPRRTVGVVRRQMALRLKVQSCPKPNLAARRFDAPSARGREPGQAPGAATSARQVDGDAVLISRSIMPSAGGPTGSERRGDGGRAPLRAEDLPVRTVFPAPWPEWARGIPAIAAANASPHRPPPRVASHGHCQAATLRNSGGGRPVADARGLRPSPGRARRRGPAPVGRHREYQSSLVGLHRIGVPPPVVDGEFDNETGVPAVGNDNIVVKMKALFVA